MSKIAYIAYRMDVMADAMEDIGQVDWAATLRGMAKDVRVMEEEHALLYNRVEFAANRLRIYGPDGVTVLRTYTLDGNGGMPMPPPPKEEKSPMIEWIDVNEQLPEESNPPYSDWVLVFPYNPDRPYDTLIGFYAFHRQRFEMEMGEQPAYDITHWMPLPKPPKEEPAQ